MTVARCVGRRYGDRPLHWVQPQVMGPEASVDRWSGPASVASRLRPEVYRVERECLAVDGQEHVFSHDSFEALPIDPRDARRLSFVSSRLDGVPLMRCSPHCHTPVSDARTIRARGATYSRYLVRTPPRAEMLIGSSRPAPIATRDSLSKIQPPRPRSTMARLSQSRP